MPPGGPLASGAGSAWGGGGPHGRGKEKIVWVRILSTALGRKEGLIETWNRPPSESSAAGNIPQPPSAVKGKSASDRSLGVDEGCPLGVEVCRSVSKWLDTAAALPYRDGSI